MDKPPTGGSLSIFLKDEAVALQNSFKSLTSQSPSVGILADPTATADFNCFTVNVTGPGIGPNPGTLKNCVSADQFRGKGLGILPLPVVRGATIEVDVPSGYGRNIDVYGVYPPTPECTGGNTSGGSGGYFLGGLTTDLLDTQKSVTIPISFNASSLAGRVTCDGNSNSAPATVYKYYVYVAGPNTLAAHSLNLSTGALTSIGNTTVSNITRVRSAPEKTYVFALTSTPDVAPLALTNATGALTAGTSASVVASSTKIAVTHNMDYLFTSSGSTITPVAIASNGVLTPKSDIALSVSILTTHPSLSIVYGTDGTDLFSYTYNTSTGALTQQSTISQSGVSDIKIDPSGRYLYALTTNTVYSFSLNTSTGAITGSLSNASITGNGTSIAVHPSGNMLYAVRGPAANSVMQVSINTANGALTTGANEATGGSNPNIAMADPTGNYLLVSNNGSNNLSIFTANPTTGVLTTSPSTSGLSFGPTDVFVTKIPQ